MSCCKVLNSLSNRRKLLRLTNFRGFRLELSASSHGSSNTCTGATLHMSGPQSGFKARKNCFRNAVEETVHKAALSLGAVPFFATHHDQ